MSSITLNIVEPTAENTVVPVPDTGLYTSTSGDVTGNPELVAIIAGTILILTLAAFIAILVRRYHLHKAKAETYQNKKRFSAALVALALMVSTSTFTFLMSNTNKNNTNATGDTSDEVSGTDNNTDGNTENDETQNSNNGGLTINTSNTEFTIELEDKPVFAVLPVEISVEESTQTGYILSTYTEETNLVSTSNSSNIIPMVVADEEELVSLANNTYGLALVEPTSEEDEVYRSLPDTEDSALVIKETDYIATEENDTTTFYYGFYITPDVPYGTYTSADINYIATPHRTDLAKVTFDGNGLYFDNNPEETQNVVRYIPGSSETRYSHTQNLDDNGEIVDPSYPNRMYPINTSETFTYDFEGADYVYVNIVRTGYDSCSYGAEDDAYFSFWTGIHPEYTAETNHSTGIKVFGNTTGRYAFGKYANNGSNEYTILDGDGITMAYYVGSGGSSRGCSSGYGYYAAITGYTESKVFLGEYKLPATSDLEGYQLLGWSEDPNATAPAYKTDEIINPNLFPIEAGDDITLYAIWTPVPFSVGYDGNGATAGSMESADTNNGIITTLGHQDIILGDKLNLYAPNYKKDGYGFVGWSQDAEAWSHLTNEDNTDDPVIYGPNQTVTASRDMVMSSIGKEDGITLYATWAPSEKDDMGSPVYLQNWNGCSNLDATTYDADTNTLSVGKNTITALTDNRDGEIYTIARLADGNCWMTENLRLADTHKEGDEVVQTVLTPENTNNPKVNNGVVELRNSDGNFSNHLSPHSTNWCNYWDNECYDYSYIYTNNSNLGDSGLVASYNETGDYVQWYSYGNYYNWYSATAGKGTYDMGDAVNVEGDICPKGWELPYGGTGTGSGAYQDKGYTKGGFYYLNQKMGNYETSEGSNNWRSFPNNFIYAGAYSGSYPSSINRGTLGSYWTASTSRIVPTSSQHMYFSESQVREGMDGTGKYSGHSVRCVLVTEE